MNDNNDEGSLELLNRLLEQLHQADYHVLGSIVLNIYKPGSQHVEHVDRQYISLTPTPSASPKGEGNLKGEENLKEEPFDNDTPLSALFRESHHEEVKKRIEMWRPYLTNASAMVDALNIAEFQFDFTAIRPVNIYMDLAHLVNHDALRPPMSVLAGYMYLHSNLSKSKNALYVQLKRYRKMCE